MENCLLKTRNINFLVTHVYREQNNCVDVLTNVGLSLNHITIWLEVPLCIRSHYVKHMMGMPVLGLLIFEEVFVIVPFFFSWFLYSFFFD